MSVYRTINTIFLEKGIVYCKRKSGKGKQALHQRQGSLDGACGAYSLAMDLMITGLINSEDIFSISKIDKRLSANKLIKELIINNGLYIDGRYLEEYKNMVDKYLSKDTEIILYSDKNKIIEVLQERIGDNIPSVLDIQYSGGGHFVVVVGMSFDDLDNPLKILCLDPLFESPSISVWNSIIDIQEPTAHKQYCYIWETNNNTPVYLNGSLTIQKKSPIIDVKRRTAG